MPLDWKPFVEFVRTHQHFILTTHVRPDGDGLGSLLALDEALRHLGKQTHLTVASSLPPRYEFLDPHRRIVPFQGSNEACHAADAIVVLDTSTWNQLGEFGDFLRASNAAKVVLDHHLTQDDLQAQRFVDPTAEATGRLVYEALQALPWQLTPSAAEALFVAVAMDTGWFRFANVRPATLALAAELVQAGARPEILYEQLFERNSLGRLKLMGLVLERLQVTHGGRVAYTEIHRGDYEAVGAVPQDSEDLVNFTRSVAGVEIGLFFLEQPRGGIKVSFRSRGPDVARLAERFGGGGHKLASGATLTTTLPAARAAVLAAVEDVLKGTEEVTG